MKVGDLVKRLWHTQNQWYGIIVVEQQCTKGDPEGRYIKKYIVHHLDGKQQKHWNHELELVSESR